MVAGLVDINVWEGCMKIAGGRFVFSLVGLALLSATTTTVLAQEADLSTAAVGYSDELPVDANSVQIPGGSMLLDYPAGAITSRGATAFDENGVSQGGVHPLDGQIKKSVGGAAFGLDTVPVFAGSLTATGGPSLGQVFPFIMIGNDPLAGGKTDIPAQITTVSLTLLNDDGSVRTTISYNPFETLTLNSPVFEPATYGDGNNVIFPDAIQRAEFFNMMKQNWHTNLVPTVVNRVNVTVPRHVNVRLANGHIVSVQNYFIGTAPNGDQFIELLDLFQHVIFQNQVINDINAGNQTTGGFGMQLWPDTFLFSINANGVPTTCCVLGFHTYFRDSSVTPQPRFVTAFVSWISPGLFGGGVQDITGLSHEVSEAYNDPFVNTAVPRWQFPGVPANAKVCQGNLETGDPVEVLPVATVPITIKETGQSFTFHPQTEALLQWFSQGPTSNAIDGAFSFPDETALPHSALPCPQ